MNSASVTRPDVPALDPARVATLADLYAERLRLSPHADACRHFEARHNTWRSLSWAELAALAQGLAGGLRALGLKPGERIAVQVPNGPDWLALDWAAHQLGLVVVALFADETPAGAAQLLEDCGARVLFTRELAQWQAIETHAPLPALRTVVAFRGAQSVRDRRVVAAERFVRAAQAPSHTPQAGDLASIVYTSGATGRPKGVMLSQRNLTSNAFAVARALDLRVDDAAFSVLPLAHLYGRVAFVYAHVVSGATLLFGRGAAHVAEDLQTLRPSVLVGSPRLYERLHGALLQALGALSPARRALFRLAVNAGWATRGGDGGAMPSRWLGAAVMRPAARLLQQRLGGRVRLAVSGGASLSPEIGRVFAALGVPLLQGYGLTEAGPVVSVNRLDDLDPASVGTPLDTVETRIAAQGELQVRGPGVMLGYWNDASATQAVIDDAGWLSTGDKVSRLDTQRIYLVGRFKELLVTATGEKAAPADIEARLRALPLVEQVMVVGEARPYLTALIVPQPGPLALLRAQIGLNDGDDSPAAWRAIEDCVLLRCQELLRDAPRNHWIVRVALVLDPWTPANGLLTSTHKLRRHEIARAHAQDIERLYAGHYIVPATDCSANAVAQDG